MWFNNKRGSYRESLFRYGGYILNENRFQQKVRDRIFELLPGAFVTKQTPHPQGIPDLLILHGDKWAMLEVKVRRQYEPNQIYYLKLFDSMGFAKEINPENMNYILDELLGYFSSTL